MITIYLLLIISFGLLTYGLYDYSKKDRENRNKLQQGYSHAEYLGGTPYFSATSQGYMRPTKTALVFAHDNKYRKPINTNWNNIRVALT